MAGEIRIGRLHQKPNPNDLKRNPSHEGQKKCNMKSISFCDCCFQMHFCLSIEDFSHFMLFICLTQTTFNGLKENPAHDPHPFFWE
jgi:hypothetical protein